MGVLVLCIFLMGKVDGVVRILTFHYNQASFIELQQRCLQRFLLDEYELIVFNDAKTEENERAIADTCQRLGVQCVRFKPEWHLTDPLNDKIQAWLTDPSLRDPAFLHLPREAFANQPSVRHSHVIQYALDHYGYAHDDVVAIMDGDAFFIRELSLKQRLKEVDICGMTREVKEKGVSYLWVPFVAFKPSQLPDVKELRFHVAVIDHKIHDTGAQSQAYLTAHPAVTCRKTLPAPSHRLQRRTSKELKQAGYTKQERWLIRHLPRQAVVEFNIENAVLHFREVSFLMRGHQEKTDCLMAFMERILSNSVPKSRLGDEGFGFGKQSE